MVCWRLRLGTVGVNIEWIEPLRMWVMRSQFQLIWPPFLPQNPSFCVDLHRARPQTHTNHFDVHTPLMKYQHSHGLLQGVPQTSGFNKFRICSWSTIGRMDGGLFPGRVNIITFSHVPRLWSPHIFLSSWYFYLSSGYFFWKYPTTLLYGVIAGSCKEA